MDNLNVRAKNEVFLESKVFEIFGFSRINTDSDPKKSCPSVDFQKLKNFPIFFLFNDQTPSVCYIRLDQYFCFTL